MKILAITGASGGHIFPALGFLDTLKNRDKNLDTLLVLPKKSLTNQRENLAHKLNYVSISTIKLGFAFKNLASILRFFKGALESIFILSEFRPDIVVGFGSLVCIPMILFAWLFRRKTLLHEQNVIPGRANRFLAKFADKIAISFAETGDYFKDYKRKVILTGNPMRKELKRIDKNKALSFFEFKSDKFTLLVMGGSQGSHRINLGFLRAVSAISDKSGFQVIHLAGPRDHDLLKDGYRALNINFHLFNFLEPMQFAYSACDLVVSRAGAATVAEIILFGLAAIIIPYPFAYMHQTSNARVLENIGSGIIIQDNALSSDMLSKNIEHLLNNPERLKAMRSCYNNFSFPNANDLLADAVLSLSKDISYGMK